MTVTETYMNKFDKALSVLISNPEEIIQRLDGDKIKYLALVTDEAYNAGFSLKNVAAILWTVNDLTTRFDLESEGVLDLIFNTISIGHANFDASKSHCNKKEPKNV